jgi:hypothetical protein
MACEGGATSTAFLHGEYSSGVAVVVPSVNAVKFLRRAHFQRSVGWRGNSRSIFGVGKAVSDLCPFKYLCRLFHEYEGAPADAVAATRYEWPDLR